MGKYLDESAVERAMELYLDGLPNGEKLRSQPVIIERLTAKTKQIAEQVDDLLADIQALAAGDSSELALLYDLLKQLPVVDFEPLNYAFVGRVTIPIENVLDLLIHLDVYTSGQPVRKGGAPGTVELVSLTEEPPETVSAEAEEGIDIAGIGPAYAALLREQADVRTAQDLLERISSPYERANLAEQTGLSESLLLKWAHRADLMRIEGIGEEYGRLAESVGVTSVNQLARHDPEKLYHKLKLTNEIRQLADRVPAIEEIQHWIDQAKRLRTA
jgi:predicted flap endonuclease-1-like 5' DNA nuclease